jgi:hypothetical protein
VPDDVVVGLGLVVDEGLFDGAGEVDVEGLTDDGLLGLDVGDVGVGCGSLEFRPERANAPIASRARPPAIAQNHQRL